MKRYYVKSHFNGWREVPKENYDRFIENIRKHATGLNESKKERFIKQVTKIMQD